MYKNQASVCWLSDLSSQKQAIVRLAAWWAEIMVASCKMCKHFGLEDRGHEVRTNFAEQSIDCLHARCCFTMWWLFTFFERVSSFEVFGGPHEGDFPTYSHSVWIYSTSVKSCQLHRLFQNIPYVSLLDFRSIYVPLLARDACPSSRSLMKQTVHPAFNTTFLISWRVTVGLREWCCFACRRAGRATPF